MTALLPNVILAAFLADWRDWWTWDRLGPVVRPALGAVLVLALTVIVYRIIMRGLGALHRRGKISFVLLFLIRRVLRWIAAAVALLLVLGALGILGNAWAALTTLFGLIAVGFIAVWSILSNTLCAVLLIVTRPFEIGDTIEIPGEAGGIKGKAVNFNLLYTTLKGEDGVDIQIPNNLFFQKPLKRRAGAVQVSLDEQLMKETAAQ